MLMVIMPSHKENTQKQNVLDKKCDRKISSHIAKCASYCQFHWSRPTKSEYNVFLLM